MCFVVGQKMYWKIQSIMLSMWLSLKSHYCSHDFAVSYFIRDIKIIKLFFPTLICLELNVSCQIVRLSCYFLIFLWLINQWWFWHQSCKPRTRYFNSSKSKWIDFFIINFTKVYLTQILIHVSDNIYTGQCQVGGEVKRTCMHVTMFRDN